MLVKTLAIAALGLASQQIKCTGIDSKQEIIVTEAIMNDNYCDCLEGIDEPLTSACYHTEFVCKQENARPKTIDSWVIDDLKCDCCDGMDENNVKCPNTCQSLGMEQRALEKIQKIILDEGLKNRDNLIMKAKSAHEKDKSELTAKQLQLNQMVKDEVSVRDSVHLWTLKKQKSDHQMEQKRREQCPEILELQQAHNSISAKENEISTLNEELHKINEKYNELLEFYHKFYSRVTETVDLGIIMEKDELNEFLIAEEMKEPPVTADTAEDQKSYTAEDQKSSEDTDTIDSIDSRIEEVPVQDNCPATLIGLGVCIPKILLDYMPGFTLSSTAKTLNPAIVRSRLEQYQKKLDDHLSAQTALTKEIADIQTRIDKDFGPDRIWQALDQTCISVDDIEYIYEVCLFGSAKQKSKKDSSEISLGNFADFKDRSDVLDPAYKTMMYNNGQVVITNK